ncbi:MAG: hypothetical protein Kow0037_06530 [Calditrichia bacterium]
MSSNSKTTLFEDEEVFLNALPRSLFFYGLLFCLFHIGPVFLTKTLWNKLQLGDLLDLLTPAFLIGCLLWVIRRNNPMKGQRFGNSWLLFGGMILFVEGHGMHLAANAIQRHLVSDMPAALLRLTYFFDEQAGHIFWDGGNLLLAGLLLNQRRVLATRLSPSGYFQAVCGGLLYGFTFFANAVEGQTAFMILPAILGLLLAELRWIKHHRQGMFHSPIDIFFVAAAICALFFFLVWYFWQGGLPEFSKVGWI